MQVNEFLAGEMSRGMSERNKGVVAVAHLACQFADTRKVASTEEGVIHNLIPMIVEENLSGKQVARLLVMGLMELGQKALDRDDMGEFLLVLSDIIAVATYLRVTGRADADFLDELDNKIANMVMLLAAHTQPDSFVN